VLLQHVQREKSIAFPGGIRQPARVTNQITSYEIEFDHVIRVTTPYAHHCEMWHQIRHPTDISNPNGLNQLVKLGSLRIFCTSWRRIISSTINRDHRTKSVGEGSDSASSARLLNPVTCSQQHKTWASRIWVMTSFKSW